MADAASSDPYAEHTERAREEARKKQAEIEQPPNGDDGSSGDREPRRPVGPGPRSNADTADE